LLTAHPAPATLDVDGAAEAEEPSDAALKPGEEEGLSTELCSPGSQEKAEVQRIR